MSDPASSSPSSDSSTPTTSGAEGTGKTTLGRGSLTPSVVGACPDAVSSKDSPADVEKDQAPLTDLASVDSQASMIDWITQLSTPALSEVSGDDVPSLTSDPQTSSVLPVGALTDHTETAAVDVRQKAPTFDGVTVTDTSTCTHTTGHSTHALCRPVNAQAGLRSRFGRFVKPVDRLIQTMSRQDVVRDKFDVKAICEFLFRVLTD